MKTNWDFSDFISKHWPKLAALFLALIATIFICQQFASKKSVESKRDFITLQKTYDSYQSGTIPSVDDLNTIVKIVAKHPELHPKYDGLLAQCFIYQDNIAQAMTFASSSMERIEKNNPSPYLQFSEATLAIADHQLTVAFEKSQQLDHFLNIDQSKPYSFLQLANLIRIAMLSQHLNLVQPEIAAWEKIRFISSETALCSQEIFERMNTLFKDGQVSLTDYMLMRMQELTKNPSAI